MYKYTVRNEKMVVAVTEFGSEMNAIPANKRVSPLYRNDIKEIKENAGYIFAVNAIMIPDEIK